MSSTAMRIEVRNAYSGKYWKLRVDAMSTEQIVAVYMRLKLSGKIK